MMMPRTHTKAGPKLVTSLSLPKGSSATGVLTILTT